jgi:hypothetical protein
MVGPGQESREERDITSIGTRSPSIIQTILGEHTGACLGERPLNAAVFFPRGRESPDAWPVVWEAFMDYISIIKIYYPNCTIYHFLIIFLCNRKQNLRLELTGHGKGPGSAIRLGMLLPSISRSGRCVIEGGDVGYGHASFTGFVYAGVPGGKT